MIVILSLQILLLSITHDRFINLKNFRLTKILDSYTTNTITITKKKKNEKLKINYNGVNGRFVNNGLRTIKI